MYKTLLKSLAVLATMILAALPSLVNAQGVVSSGITGTVLDDAGNPLANATVTVVHVPTNSTATAVTGSNGRFKVSGLRPGGPYTVSATATGFTVRPVNNIQTALGEDSDIVLSSRRGDIVQLEEFVTTASASDLDGNATGAGSTLSNRGVLNQPTSNRSFADMMKTNPFVTIRAFPQVTALGMNNRYNSITLDGARLNDQFGLASSGLFSLKNPFSLDAVEAFSVQLTPYDVTQSGFAGASINVVSKSGTNEFHGSSYYIYTSNKWQGKDVSGTNAGNRPGTFYERTYGATLGGPIWKDRVFFFLNYEKYSSPGSGPSNSGFTPDGNAITAINSAISALPNGASLGKFGAGTPTLVEDEKKLAKIDWQITKDHRLTVRYSETEGTQPFSPNFRATGISSPVPTGATTSYANGVTSFSSNFYDLAVLEKVWASQLFSNWTPDLKTEITFSKNDTNSLRSTPVNYPEIIIQNVPTTTGITSGNAILVGTDVSSMGNGVISNNTSFGGNATYTWRDFTFKAGFDHEQTDFENLFRSGSYGVFSYNYSPTMNLLTDAPLGFVRGVASEGFPGTDISKLEQTGYFLQAKWEPTQRFNATFGLRFDELGSPIAPPDNAAFAAAFNSLVPGIRNNGTIDGTSQLAPRFSFNYALNEDRTLQLRGGLGVFLGRNPWVWISNSYGNAGYGRFTLTAAGASAPSVGQYLNGTFSDTDPAFKFDPASPLGTTRKSAAAGISDINLIKNGLKLPTNLRGNLALDYKLKNLDAILTIEYIHSEVMEAMFYQNLNLVADGKAADGRSYFRRALINSSTGALIAYIPVGSTVPSSGNITLPDGSILVRPSGSAVTSNTYSTNFARVLRLSNTGAGASDYVAIGIDRPFKNGWAYNVTYTRGKSTEAQPAGSSTASSQFSFNVVRNQGEVEVSRSDYEVRDRIQASISREFNFLKRLKTSATLYYEGRSGQPYSWVYSGDLNLDANNANDAVAVPTGASDPRFNFSSMTSAQQTAYFAFINSSGLSRYAGGYAPRNAFIGPWQNRLDLHFSQEVKVAGPVQIELFADFINFGTWLSKDLFNYVETINNTTTNSNQIRVLGNASLGADGRIIPTVSLNSDGSLVIPATSTITPNNTDSRWRIQAGARIRF